MPQLKIGNRSYLCSIHRGNVVWIRNVHPALLNSSVYKKAIDDGRIKRVEPRPRSRRVGIVFADSVEDHGSLLTELLAGANALPDSRNDESHPAGRGLKDRVVKRSPRRIHLDTVK